MFTHIIAATLLSTLALGAPAISKRQTSSKITAANGQCLGFTDSTEIANGTPIGGVDCNSNKAISWVFDVNQPSSIRPSGNTDFALDAGTNPSNFGKVHLWQSYPGLYQQT